MNADFEVDYSKLENLDKYCQKIKDIVSKDFETSLTTLNVDLEKNQKDAFEKNNNLEIIRKTTTSIKIKKILRWFLIIFLIFPFVLLTKAANKQQVVLNDVIESNKKLEKKIFKNIIPLISYYSYNHITKNILNKVFDNIAFYKDLDPQHYDIWKDLLISLDINDTSCVKNMFFLMYHAHPCLMLNKKIQEWGQHVYTGSIAVPYRNSEGQMCTDIVTATVTWPKPYWIENDLLVLKSNIANSLSFHNESNLKNERKIKKFYKKNSDQVQMENAEFDKLFPCIRNDEQQFRTLFSVLTQEKFVDLFNQIKFLLNKQNKYFYVDSCFNTNKTNNDIKVDYDLNGLSNFDYDLMVFQSNLTKKLSDFVLDLLTIQLPYANLVTILHEKYLEQDKKQNDGLIVQFETFVNNVINKHAIPFKTDTIAKIDGYNFYQKDKHAFILIDAIVNSFNPEPKVVPTLGHGSRTTAMVPVTVIDYKPATTNLFILVIDKVDKQDCNIDEATFIENGKLFYYSTEKISQREIDSLVKNI